MNQNIPGLEELREWRDTIYNAQAEYDAAFQRMMESEDGITSSLPSPITDDERENYEWLVKQYPRSALYLRAEDYTQASNHHKYSAGKKAMQMVADGAEIKDIEEVLNNWLPESALWD